MVRKITMQGRLDFATPEVLFEYLFQDDKFMKAYHKKVNYDPDAEVTCWNENQEREVKYVASLQAPKMISKLAGDTFPVREIQKYTKKGDCFIITSAPSTSAPGGEMFFTYAETTLSPDGEAGSAITVNVSLEFRGRVWGLEGAVENFMESKTRTTFDQWMAVAKSFCQERMSLPRTREEDLYFDAEEEGVELATQTPGPMQGPARVNGILNRFRAAFSGNEDTETGLNVLFTQIVSRDINDIQISCDALKGHVEKLNARLIRMEHDLVYIKSSLERQQLERQQLGVPTGILWSLFGLGAATGLSIAFMYMHIRKHRQT